MDETLSDFIHTCFGAILFVSALTLFIFMINSLNASNQQQIARARNKAAVTMGTSGYGGNSDAEAQKSAADIKEEQPINKSSNDVLMDIINQPISEDGNMTPSFYINEEFVSRNIIHAVQEGDPIAIQTLKDMIGSGSFAVKYEYSAQNKLLTVNYEGI